MPKHTSLPGYPLAQRIMSETARDFDALYDDALDGCDIDDPETGTRRKRPSPDLCLNALMILRLMSSHAAAGSPSMLPQPGAVTLIFVPGFDDVKRLRPLMEKLNVELMSSGKTRPQHLVNLDIIAQPSAGATVHDMRRFNESIRDVALRGNPALVIAGSERAVDPDIERIASATLRLEPATSQMLEAVLKLLFPGSRQSTPKVDLSGMGELQLARVFAADGAAGARKALRALKPMVASTAGAPTITLDKVHGQPGAKAAFQQLLDDLNDWRKGSLDWSEVTSSFIFHGPPGTGKTMLSEALAGSAGVSFIRTSYSDCQRHGHQGDMLRVLTETVEKAITNAPAILFIDEIDSFYSRTGDTRFSGYMTGVVNGLLTLLDRLNSTPGVIVIGATNHLSMIDPAIIRPGRFDCHIPVDPLDRSGVMAMIAAQIPDILNDDEAQMLADQLIGQTGATVAAMLRDARTKSRRDRIPMTARHIFDAAEAVAPVPDPELLRRVALHEAGHLLMGHLSGFSTPKRAALQGRGGEILREMPDVLTPSLANGMLKIYLAGRVTEAMFFNEISSGAGGAGRASDLALATAMALQIEVNFGFADRLTWHDPTIPPNLHSHEIRIAVEKRLQASDSAVRAALAPHVRDLERIAQALMDERELDRDRLSELLAAVPIPGNADKTDHPLSSAG